MLDTWTPVYIRQFFSLFIGISHLLKLCVRKKTAFRLVYQNTIFLYFLQSLNDISVIVFRFICVKRCDQHPVSEKSVMGWYRISCCNSFSILFISVSV